VVYSDWKSGGIAGGVDALALIKETIANFYLNPNANTFNAVLDIMARYEVTARRGDAFASMGTRTLLVTMQSLNGALATKMVQESPLRYSLAERPANDPRFNIFSTPFR
jgi:hypothetical protein